MKNEKWKMDSIVDRIVSSNIGPKWAQLFSRLGLGPRNRYRFEADHGGKASGELYTGCLRDTIEHWKSTVVKDKDEREAARLLLCALEGVQGYGDLARELSAAHDIELHPSDPRDPSHPDSESLHRPIKAIKVEVDHTQFELQSLQDRSQPPTDSVTVDSSFAHLSADADLQHGNCDKKLKVMEGSISGIINLTNTLHKYAVLDICQRICSPCKAWKLFAKALQLPQDTINELIKEEAMEERYYLAIKNWVTLASEAHTFAELQEILKHLNCEDALLAMHARLSVN